MEFCNFSFLSLRKTSEIYLRASEKTAGESLTGLTYDNHANISTVTYHTR